MSAEVLTEAGAARLLGTWTGQMPAPELYAQPRGEVTGAGRQLLRLLGEGTELLARVRFGPARGTGWRIDAIELVDQTGQAQARLPLPAPVRVRAGQAFEYTLRAAAVASEPAR